MPKWVLRLRKLSSAVNDRDTSRIIRRQLDRIERGGGEHGATAKYEGVGDSDQTNDRVWGSWAKSSRERPKMESIVRVCTRRRVDHRAPIVARHGSPLSPLVQSEQAEDAAL